ncbi:penicillin-binding transpeptidase domain-containing protein [Thermobifida alba]|uniref:penicillin-binding transpeptidase domain-containing protein n=1 Tax=Thermobifida alba TaxID=53522 RepID=UPI00200B59B7|nr:penicillin-binding transpeptidase domain-containing protein [Thermobifida alba]
MSADDERTSRERPSPSEPLPAPRRWHGPPGDPHHDSGPGRPYDPPRGRRPAPHPAEHHHRYDPDEPRYDHPAPGRRHPSDDPYDSEDEHRRGGGPRRRARRGPLLAVLAAVLVVALVGGGVYWYLASRPAPEDTVAAYAAAWSSGDHPALDRLATSGEASALHSAVAENLGVESVEVTTGATVVDGDTATAPFTATLALGDTGEWTYEGELPLRRVDGQWKVDFSPAALHPALGPGQTLARSDTWGERGRVLASDGTPVDTPDVSGSIQMIVGEVGPATAEDVAELGPAYDEGDPVGKSGLQRSLQARLAGTPTTLIQVVEEGTEPVEEPEDSAVVGTVEGAPGQDVTLSIDLEVQQAAANAIIGQSKETALVAIRPSTGEVLAVANVPGGFNRALEGQYAPGSTFKIISYDALLGAGLGTDATMDCAETVDVGGWPFRNAGEAAYGAQSVTEAFATSCNTALISEVVTRLDASSLVAAAERYGFNRDLDLGVPTFTPTFPTPENETLLAAMSIGQGQMLTSPVHMATVPAAVADGHWRAPVLVTDPAPADRPAPVPVDHAEQLRAMMRAVVTDGTAEDVGFTGEVHGKTGTAEYGEYVEDEEMSAHGWFVGFEGDVAFAVIVEDGGSGAGAAAPLAQRFLAGL